MQFEKEVLKSQLPVLVEFWAPVCGPCILVAPFLEGLAREFGGKVKFVQVDIDCNADIAAAYGILSIPTILVFKGGQPVDHIIGFRPKGDLQRALQRALSEGPSPRSERPSSSP